MNPDLRYLQPYPFERLKNLIDGITAPDHIQHISLSIGEPKHSPPLFLSEILKTSLPQLSRYPTIKGSKSLRESISDWLIKRYQLGANSIDAESQILPVNGTREGIFSFSQATLNSTNNPIVVTGNPFYQIYEGAALLARAEIRFINCTEKNNFVPDLSRVPAEVWRGCQILHLCTPNNPTGAVMSIRQQIEAIELAHKHDFTIVSDECYSELYLDENQPPPGLLQASYSIGNRAFEKCVVFHSLSKRSNLPGLRSGFIAGDQNLISNFLRYRTYHGCSMSPMVQMLSESAWSDENHVLKNRKLYREKFSAVTNILTNIVSFPKPKASFYLWLETPYDDIKFARDLFTHKNVLVLPGQFMSRDWEDRNPGTNRVRIALVAPTDECVTAAMRIKSYIEGL